MEILLFILFIVLAIAGNKNKAEQKKRQAQTRRRQPPAYTPPPTATDSLPGAAFDWQEAPSYPAYDDSLPASGSMAYDSSEGLGMDAGGAFYEGQEVGSPEGKPGPESSLSSVIHVVRPFTESGHSHTESSLTGNLPCPQPPPAPPAAPYALPGAAHATARLGLRLDRAGARQGILYAEILGKPKALRQ